MEIAFSEKISPQLSAALSSTPYELGKESGLSSGYLPESDSWEVIVKYVGDIEKIKEKYPSVLITRLLGNYAVLVIEKSLVNTVALCDEIIYMEKPKQFNYDVYEGSQASCITPVHTNPYNLTGKGVLVGIIDSGIYYAHPAFIQDGVSRIAYLWDQTVSDDSSHSDIIPFGTLYDRDTITKAINAENSLEMQRICPSIDISGHGTHVAGIAAGNGNGNEQNTKYRGVAYESTLIIVKLKTSGGASFPTTTQIMLAVDFCIRKSIDMNMPIAINLSFGTSNGSHSGTSLIEAYLDYIAGNYRCAVSVGSGNDGAGFGHANGSSYPADAELAIGYPEPSLSIDLWKKYWDEIQLRISAPNNDMLEIPDTITNQAKGFTYRYNLDGTDIYITGGGPSPYSPFQEIFIELMGSEYISPGIWKISLEPISVKDGSWDIWLPSGALRNAQTSFIHASPDITLTIPSTAQNVISVGAYDSRTNRTAAFSGRGYTWAFDSIKPDIIAPGVDIISCSNTGGYTSKTGTSMAAPFVTGAAALLMEWGIVRGNDLYMYGDKLKASLIKGAGENVFTTASRAVSENSSKNTKYPNPVTGWGTLCLLDSIP